MEVWNSKLWPCVRSRKMKRNRGQWKGTETFGHRKCQIVIHWFQCYRHWWRLFSGEGQRREWKKRWFGEAAENEAVEDSYIPWRKEEYNQIVETRRQRNMRPGWQQCDQHGILLNRFVNKRITKSPRYPLSCVLSETTSSSPTLVCMSRPLHSHLLSINL